MVIIINNTIIVKIVDSSDCAINVIIINDVDNFTRNIIVIQFIFHIFFAKCLNAS